jgi:hypothetical protein
MKTIVTKSTDFNEVANTIPGFMSQAITDGGDIPLARLSKMDGKITVHLDEMVASDRAAVEKRLRRAGLL